MITRYVNTASAGGDGTTNNTSGATAAFASLFAAEAALGALNASEDVEILCCGSAADALVVVFDGIYVQTGFTLYIKGNPTDPNGAHSGVYDATKYRLTDPITQSMIIHVKSATAQRITFSKIQTLQTLGTNAAGGFYIYQCSTGMVVNIENCILKSDDCMAGVWIRTGCTVNIKNCTLSGKLLTNVGFRSASIWLQQGTSTVKVYNCLMAEGTNGVLRAAGTITAKNCSVFDFSTDFNGTITVDHCASDDGTGTNPIAVANWADEFYNVDYVTNADFRLEPTSVLLDAGIGPALDADVPTTDILDYSRSGNNAAVGAFEHEWDYEPCIPNILHGSTGGQYWVTKCFPSKHYVKYSRGLSDNPGATGFQGSTGIALQGITGTQGTQGETGVQGVQGVTGAGLDGATGSQGATGVQGSTGLRGENGVLPGSTGVFMFSFDGGDTAIQVGYRTRTKLPYKSVINGWEAVLTETGTFVTELSVGSYANWASAVTMNTGDTGPHVIDGIKNSDGDLSNWAGTTGAYGEYLQVNVLQSTVKQASVSLKHYENRI